MSKFNRQNNKLFIFVKNIKINCNNFVFHLGGGGI
ncbi:unnamed protein product [Schistosoma mattheei]|uniref:Uncharacterized protein n=1 Tax=Schistosoma mattheei TaxID=31246 RepID=A0A183PQK1_9TREM|nr:unnamed protein product [Schistosoma mattheei]